MVTTGIVYNALLRSIELPQGSTLPWSNEVLHVVLLRKRGTDSRRLAVLRTCVATYMVTTGIVYNALLRSIELPQGSTLPWSNEVLHVVAPAFLLLDLLLAPGTRALPHRTIGIVVIYPIVWAVYTLLRGHGTIDYVSGTTG